MTTLDEFKKIFHQELNDPNESFLFFLLSLIPEDKLKEIINSGSEIFYDNIGKY